VVILTGGFRHRLISEATLRVCTPCAFLAKRRNLMA
jgi:hypothetical protein